MLGRDGRVRRARRRRPTSSSAPTRRGCDQLVANLLDNASRHSPAGGTVAGHRRTDRGDRYVLEVHDQGPGRRAGRPRAGLRAVRHPQRATEGGGGTGLGLAIARWVTDLHGGTIRFVDPEPGAQRGARVRGRTSPLEPARPTARPPARRPPCPPPHLSAPAARVHCPVDRAAHRALLDGLFGGFWPERGVPARLARPARRPRRPACSPALVLPFRDLGLGTFLVLLAAGGVVLAGEQPPRTPFTLTCAGLCVLLAATTVAPRRRLDRRALPARRRGALPRAA